jgi:hypothetical protein
VKIEATKKKPATFDCKKVVATHYSDAAWKGKLADKPAKERTKSIADSRAAMTKACNDDKWSVNLRACVVTGGGTACFSAMNQSSARWGFPAMVVGNQIGIADCDLLLAHMELLAKCDKLPQSARDAYGEAGKQMLEAWKTMPSDQKQMVGQQCKMADESISQAATSMGCPM